jgi:long-chain acyl-CoA synthetase
VPVGLWAIADDDPDRVALVEAGSGRELTYGELAARANQLTFGLRALGAGQGDVVAAVLGNEAAMLELYAAALQGGWYLTPINHHLTAAEIAYVVEDSGARALVCSERFGPACRDALAQLAAPPPAFATGVVEGLAPYESLLEGQPSTRPAERSAGSTMHYTSGTTGKPKGVRRALTPGLDPDLVAELFTGFLGLFGIPQRAAGFHLTSSPLYHTAVMVFTTTSIHNGQGAVLMERWTPEDTLGLIERHGVTTSHMVPTQFHRMLALPDGVRARYDVSSLTHVIHSAAPCPVDIKRRMLEWWGPVVYEYYAATEGGGTIATPQEWLDNPGTVGRAWPNAGVKILDDDGQPCAPGEPGLVWMSLTQVDFEYHGDAEKTRSGRHDGWFTVGDIGYLTEDGFLFLCDRKIDMIISGGVNIYPAEIEAALLRHPKVGDVAVFGVPDADWGEQVKAVVEPAAGVASGPDLERELLAFCETDLASFKRPRSIDFVAELPRDPNGKLFKRRLRDPYWAAASTAI